MKLVGSEQDILFLQDVHQLLLSKHKDDIEKLLSIWGWKETQIKVFIYLLKSICFEINEKSYLCYMVYMIKDQGEHNLLESTLEVILTKCLKETNKIS